MHSIMYSVSTGIATENNGKIDGHDLLSDANKTDYPSISGRGSGDHSFHGPRFLVRTQRRI